MKQTKLKLAISFLLLFMWHCNSSENYDDGITNGLVNNQAVTFHIKNKCTFPIWPATAPTAGHPVIGDGGFHLLPSQTKRVQAPPTWIGRFWARTGCNFTSSSSLKNETFSWTSNPACKTGDCMNLLSCNGAIGLPPATLIEVALQQDMSLPSFYGVTLVEGYNLPVSMSTMPADDKCFIKGCTKSINSVCPKELQVLDKSEVVVACKSACLEFKEDAFCCRNSNSTPESCQANKYSKLFKDACPSYFSYAYDTPPPLMTCSSKDYMITFCPSKWSILQLM